MNQSHPRLHHGITFAAVMYVFSGVTQPMLMALAKAAGLADPTAQLYMVFYYLGPSLLLIQAERTWPQRHIQWQAAGIAVFDVFAQALNYTGASLAGPTLFSIIYSSVTIWCAVLSRIFLSRTLSVGQWVAVATVAAGLAMTATESIKLGQDVITGTWLIVIGSAGHAGTYVCSEWVMAGHDRLSVQQNAALQGIVALLLLLLWQLVYTRPRWEILIADPMDISGTSWYAALGIMLAFALANLVHSLAFFVTLKHYPGGATSAGVMKGLQAVLVFVASHLLYCGRLGGREMCFTSTKLASLATVVGGVIMFTYFQYDRRKEGYTVMREDARVELEHV